jgi:Tetratricopeptide Repeats-Sensor
MPISVCFVVMPFGKKLTHAGTDSIPAQIDFDLLWDKVLRPMIQDDLKYIPIRADQDAGALIIQAMIERLAISDLVLADLTIPNANVYYEVGVRHAAQKQGCVLLAADWSKPLFDVSQMRRLKYPLPDGTVSDEAAEAIRKLLLKGIRECMDHMSPVFQTIPGYPHSIRPDQMQSFRDVAQKLATFQAEVSVARGLPSALAAEHAHRLAEQYEDDAISVPSMALDLIRLLRDAQAWEKGLNFLEALPPRVRELPAIREQRALMLGKAGRPMQAIAEIEGLILSDGDTSERSGLLGGRFKTLYEQTYEEAAKLTFLNKAISCYERAMMLDLNDYFPASNLPRLYRVRQREGDERKAVSTTQLAQLACARARTRNAADPWVALTLLGVAFDAGDVVSANLLLTAITENVPPPFYLQATLPDLRRSLSLTRDPGTQASLAETLGNVQRLLHPQGTVLAIAGRRIDAEGTQQERFPAENEVLVAKRLRTMMVATACRGVVCSAACGTDILALESAGALGLERRVVLPFAVEKFRAMSVTDREEAWGERFDRILEQLPSRDVLVLTPVGDASQAYAAANAAILEEAAAWGSVCEQQTLALVVWNGLSRGPSDVTNGFRKLAEQKKLECVSVSTL